MLAKKVIKLKKAPAQPQVQAIAQAQPEPEAQAIAQPEAQAIAQPVKPKKTFKLVPPVPKPNAYLTPAQEAFELIREYCRNHCLPMAQSDITWYKEELIREKKELDEFWQDHSTTWANLQAHMRGDTIEEIDAVVAAAKLVEKKQPIRESDIGEMPPHGSPEFWAWCRKRKQLRLEKEAAIIAAGGTVKPQKAKVPKVPKVPKV